MLSDVSMKISFPKKYEIRPRFRKRVKYKLKNIQACRKFILIVCEGG